MCLLRMGSGCPWTEMDDQAMMSAEAMRGYYRLLIRTMQCVDGSRYLNRESSAAELRRITERYTSVGFPGHRGSFDCTHLHWKNCPSPLKGQCHNPIVGQVASISWEGVCDHDLYCFSWYAGRADTNNDCGRHKFPFLFRFASREANH